MPETEMLLEQFVRFRSCSQEQVNQAVDFAFTTLTEWGLQPVVHTHSGYRMLTASIGEGPVTLVLNGHLDVVPADPDQYEPEIRDGRIYGRGTYDMLGGCAVFMDVMRELHAVPPRIRVVLMLVPTEETDGSLGTGWLLEQGIGHGDFALCGEPTNLKIAIKAKGVLRLSCTVHGKAAHASRPWEGENAILKATQLFSRINGLPFAQEKSADYAGPSINLSVLHGGDVINKVPDTAVMPLDIRFLPGQQDVQILKEIQDLDPDMEIEVLRSSPAVDTASDDPFVVHLLAAAQSVAPQASLSAQHGSADTRFFQDQGIPSVEFGPAGANHHGRDEYVTRESLEQYRRIVMAFIGNAHEIR